MSLRVSYLASTTLPRAINRAAKFQQRQLSTYLVRCHGNPRNQTVLSQSHTALRNWPQKRFKSENATSARQESPVTPESKVYSFSEIKELANSPSPTRILIDVREPSEVQSTGHVPGAKSLPINSAPEGLFLPAEDFEEKFGWPKPRSSDELVFYCKAGVRSRAAASFAKSAGWTKVGEYPGSWLDWVENGGKIERD